MEYRTFVMEMEVNHLNVAAVQVVVRHRGAQCSYDRNRDNEIAFLLLPQKTKKKKKIFRQVGSSLPF